jgi:hypothetical protein
MATKKEIEEMADNYAIGTSNNSLDARYGFEAGYKAASEETEEWKILYQETKELLIEMCKERNESQADNERLTETLSEWEADRNHLTTLKTKFAESQAESAQLRAALEEISCLALGGLDMSKTKFNAMVCDFALRIASRATLETSGYEALAAIKEGMIHIEILIRQQPNSIHTLKAEESLTALKKVFGE